MLNSNRGRIRSSAHKEGISSYNSNYLDITSEELPVSSSFKKSRSTINDNPSYLTVEETVTMGKFVQSNHGVMDAYMGGNPTASDVNLLIQTEDENRAKLFAQYHDAFLNNLNPIPYAESQVDTNPFGPFNYPSDVNGYGMLGGYNTSNMYPSFANLARRNTSYNIPENKIVETQASMTPFYSNDTHHRLVNQTPSKSQATMKKALRSFIKENNLS